MITKKSLIYSLILLWLFKLIFWSQHLYTMISFSFILNFSLSYLLRSNLISDSLKAPSDLHNISLNSASVQTMWIPHVEKAFICENWSAPDQTESIDSIFMGRDQGWAQNVELGLQDAASPPAACWFQSVQVHIVAHYHLRSVYPA